MKKSDIDWYKLQVRLEGPGAPSLSDIKGQGPIAGFSNARKKLEAYERDHPNESVSLTKCKPPRGRLPGPRGGRPNRRKW